ncbi:MAG: hypothetical protein PF495_01640 [Spirochaetales bacterium]|nr:hypothetical protein [Spirochaetales bacterium]
MPARGNGAHPFLGYELGMMKFSVNNIATLLTVVMSNFITLELFKVVSLT